jgi:SNF2 family DNA or RNA helicase
MPADTETSVPFLAALPPRIECMRKAFVLVPPGSDGGHETVAVVEKTASRIGRLRGLNSTPRRYQRNGIKWLLFLYDNHFGGLLCDDMGLGKTHQVPGLFCAVKEQRRADGNRRHLVVCPATVMSHWLRLCTLFAPGLTVHTYYGSERSLPST